MVAPLGRGRGAAGGEGDIVDTGMGVIILCLVIGGATWMILAMWTYDGCEIEKWIKENLRAKTIEHIEQFDGFSPFEKYFLYRVNGEKLALRCRKLRSGEKRICKISLDTYNFENRDWKH